MLLFQSESEWICMASGWIKLKSKEFENLEHWIEIDLYCYEKSDFCEIENSLMAESSKIRYPPIIDQWLCCEQMYARYSDIVCHVERTNLPLQISPIHGAFKLICPSCKSLFISYDGAISHFLKQHVISRLLCLQCNSVYFKREDYCAHVNKCNDPKPIDKAN